MGKNKKKLSDIKSALLSNTSFINNVEEPAKILEPAENMVELDKHVLSKMKMLAKFYGKEKEELINEALNHYLRLKKMDIEEALKNMVVGNADDE
jgi:hypothetical protein